MGRAGRDQRGCGVAGVRGLASGIGGASLPWRWIADQLRASLLHCGVLSGGKTASWWAEDVDCQRARVPTTLHRLLLGDVVSLDGGPATRLLAEHVKNRIRGHVAHRAIRGLGPTLFPRKGESRRRRREGSREGGIALGRTTITAADTACQAQLPWTLERATNTTPTDGSRLVRNRGSAGRFVLAP